MKLTSPRTLALAARILFSAVSFLIHSPPSLSQPTGAIATMTAARASPCAISQFARGRQYACACMEERSPLRRAAAVAPEPVIATERRTRGKASPYT